MNTMQIILLLLILCIIIFVIAEKIELTKFRTTTYEIRSENIREPFCAAVVADLHSHVYGEGNAELIQAIKDMNPDLILIPGDMFTQDRASVTEIAEALLTELVKIAPVYYSNGNHETRIQKPEEGRLLWEGYQKRMEKIGVQFVNNRTEIEVIHGQVIAISGFESDMRYYDKGKTRPMYLDEVTKTVEKTTRPIHYQILLAHNPVYFECYKAFGADATFSGHMHGGLVRIPGIGSVISPQFKLFPKYDAGQFVEDGKHLIISKGLGTHTFNIRVFNRAEVLKVNFLPEES